MQNSYNKKIRISYELDKHDDNFSEIKQFFFLSNLSKHYFDFQKNL